MTTCEKHGCALTPLFTSAFCARCDEEAAVNAPLADTADGLRRAMAQVAAPHDAGWYHNYPVRGTDANGSDVDDMDVCMGFKSEAEAKVVCDRIMARYFASRHNLA